MYPIIVQKYGGSSVDNTEKIKNIAKKIIEKRKSGYNIVVVVSAQGDTTDELIQKAKEITYPHPIPPREADMLLSVGERISIALLSMAINTLGFEATSLTGSQSGIITDCRHTNANIVDVRPHRILKELEKGKIVIVAGYQGVSIEKEITTLGRGGSDLTAIALAVALKAERCEIYKDVDGIFDSNPATNPNAKLLETITSEELSEMASGGAKVIDLSAVKIWQKYSNDKLILNISNSHKETKGTIIVNSKENLSENKVTAINSIKDCFLIIFELKKLTEIFCFMRENNLLPLIFYENEDKSKYHLLLDKEKSDIVFSGSKNNLFAINEEYSLISAVGKNIGIDIDIIEKWENYFLGNNMNIKTIYNNNKILTIIKKDYLDKVLKDLYKLFL